ncbi:Mus7/MMS22 family-domain-containing protein [Phellopilus nigrolimitatus]|nr:Mus7/MMS22 family-domain-containing protein [Phellopilus nigrolimitatus]
MTDTKEYVETSDPEELAETFEIFSPCYATPAVTSSPRPSAAERRTPRKRRKLSHVVETLDGVAEETIPSLEELISKVDSENAGSSTPVSFSSGFPTSTAFSLEEDESDLISQKIQVDSSDEDGLWDGVDEFGVGGQVTQLEEPDALNGIGLGAYNDGSEDELDMISQPRRTNPPRSLRSTGTLHSTSLALSPNDERPSNHLTDGLALVSPSLGPQAVPKPSVIHEIPDRNHGPSPLFSSQRGVSPTRPSASGSKESHGNSSPISSPPDSSHFHNASKHRFSSLPPSSPFHTSTYSPLTPLRALSLSPGLPSLSRSQLRGENNGAEDPFLVNDDAHVQFQADEDNAPRRYSLRARQARQLNPYEYEKRIYKQQMRNNPDAIVKIVSPRRRLAEAANRNRDPQEEDDEFVAPDDGDESQGRLHRRNIRHRSHAVELGDGENGTRKSPKWFPKAFEMSDDELPPLEPLRPEPASASKRKTESGKIKRRKISKFPLLESRARKNADAVPVQDDEKDKQRTVGPGITYARRKSSVDRTGNSRSMGSEPGLSHPQLSAAKRSRSASVCSSNDPVHPNSPGDYDFGGNGLDDDGANFGAMDIDGSRKSSPAPADNDELLRSPNSQSHGRPNRNEPKSDQSLSEESHLSESDSDIKLTKRERKKKRVWLKTMPAVMRNKLMEEAAKQSKQPFRARSRSIAHGSGDGNEDDEDDDWMSLAPGRSRIRKRAGGPEISELADIRGDAESEPESNDQNGDTASAVGSAEDRSGSELSSDDSCFGDPGREDLLNGAALDGNTGYFDLDFSRPIDKEEDLIDRMLCITRKSKSKSSSKRNPGKQKRRRGVASRLTNTRGAGFRNGDSLGGPQNRALDVVIGSRPHHQHRQHRHSNVRLQTRLPFSAVSGATNRRSPDDDEVVDLTTTSSPPLSPKAAGDSQEIQLEHHEQPRKLTKKQRREKARRAQLYTFASGGRKVTSGRKKAFIQIDFADDGFREALAPARSDGHGHKIVPSKRIFHRTASGGKPKSSKAGFAAEREPALRQTSLHDYREDGSVEDFAVGIPVAAQRTDFIDTWRNDDDAHASGDLRRPQQYTGFGLVDMDSDMSSKYFAEALEVASNILHEWLDEAPNEAGDEGILSDEEGKGVIQTAVSYCTQRLSEKACKILDGCRMKTRDFDSRLFAVLWFNVELNVRLLSARRRLGLEANDGDWQNSISLLVQSLLVFGLRNTMDPIQNAKLEDYSTALRTAEIWICLIHLLPRVAESNVLWSYITQAVQKDKLNLGSDVEVSEHLWRLIFSLTALSQISVHGNSTIDIRLPTSWDVVALALDAIRLTHDPDKDKNRPEDSLKKRDQYVRMVVARCYLLGTKWKWSLRDAHVMFKKLVVIFKSRMFANLLGENSDFPAFLRYADLELLNKIRSSDTAFSLFLKLVVHAAKVDESGQMQENAKSAQARLTKLLSLTVPLSGVPFLKTQPSSKDELSMLYNRFSSIIVAIYVDPTDVNVKSRLDQARRYINFGAADDGSRTTCIRAAMHVAILVQHLSLSLAEPLKWLGEMTDTLLREFQHASTLATAGSNPQQGAKIVDRERNKATLFVQVILGCVRKILETPSMSAIETSTAQRYPDVGLLRGPWVKRVFSLKDLTNVATTRFAILQLVRSFLDARTEIIPPPRRPALHPLESSESQDLYDEFGLDDDVLAALDLGEGVATMNDNQEKDKEVAEVIMNADIVPAILRLVLQFFNDPMASSTNEARIGEYWSNADDWIDCWVRCAAIVYSAINIWEDREYTFLVVLLESLVSFRITMENEYSSLLLSVDGLRHTMLRALPIDRESELVDFRLSRGRFIEKRIGILEASYASLTELPELATNRAARDNNASGFKTSVRCTYQALGFLIAWTFQFDKITDFTGALLTLLIGNTFYARNIVASVLVMVWASRLAGFWAGQIVWVWTVSLPLIILNSPAVSDPSLGGSNPSFGTSRDIAGIVLWALGWAIESIADIQKFLFKSSKPPKDQPPSPNIESSLVYGSGLATLPTSARLSTGAIMSPIFTTLLLMFASGVPSAEKPTAKKYFLLANGVSAKEEHKGAWTKYKDYLRSTSIVIPLPPALYKPLPAFVKSTVLLDFPMYRFDEKTDGPQAVEEDRKKVSQNA